MQRAMGDKISVSRQMCENRCSGKQGESETLPVCCSCRINVQIMIPGVFMTGTTRQQLVHENYRNSIIYNQES